MVRLVVRRKIGSNKVLRSQPLDGGNRTLLLSKGW